MLSKKQNLCIQTTGLISWQQRPCRLKFPGKEMRPRKQIKGNEIHRKLAGNYR